MRINWEPTVPLYKKYEEWTPELLKEVVQLIWDVSKYLRQFLGNPPREISDYWEEVSRAIPQFFGRSIVEKNAPAIFSASLHLIWEDFLPVFIASYSSSLIEKLCQSSENSLPPYIQYFFASSGSILTSALSLYIILRKIQFQLRTSVMLLVFPKEFHAMKKDTPKIDNSVCKSCNQLRFAKGELRSILLYFFRMFFIEGLKNIGGVFNLISVPLQIFFTGQVIAEYHYASAGVCEQHRDVNFQEYRELFLMFGVLHTAGTYLFSNTAPFTINILKVLLEKPFGESSLIPRAVNTFAEMPSSLYQMYVSSILMFFLIGSAYYTSFPKTVKDTKRWFIDPSRPVIEILTEASVSVVKRNIRLRRENSLEFSLTKKIENWYQYGYENFGKCKAIANRYPRISKLCQDTALLLQHEKLIKLYWLFLPKLLREKTALLGDSILIKYWPSTIYEIKNVLVSVKNYRLAGIKILKWAEKIDAFFSKSSVSWTLTGLSYLIPGGVILPKTAELFTVDFIINKAPKYLGDIDGICQFFNSKGIMSDENYEAIAKSCSAFKKNVETLKKLLNEIPKSLVDDLLLWLQTKEFDDQIDNVILHLDAMTAILNEENRPQIEALGFVVDCEDFDPCEWDAQSPDTADAGLVDCVSHNNHGGLSSQRVLTQTAPSAAAVTHSDDDWYDATEEPPPPHLIKPDRGEDDEEDESGFVLPRGANTARLFRPPVKKPVDSKSDAVQTSLTQAATAPVFAPTFY